MPKNVDIQVSREIANDEDLRAYLSRVSSAVFDNASVFGNDDGWELGVTEITPSSIVVRDYEAGRYLRADYSTDGEDVSFSNVKVVKRTWTEVGELGSVVRSEDDIFVTTMTVPTKEDENVWSGLDIFKLP
jgi:hypothetical protein